MLQTDGWLSSNSAKVYESSTETLFVGRQDAMQRQTLVPLAPFMASLPFSTQPPKIIDVAAGTGRFATFLKVGLFFSLLQSCQSVMPHLAHSSCSVHTHAAAASWAAVLCTVQSAGCTACILRPLHSCCGISRQWATCTSA